MNGICAGLSFLFAVLVLAPPAEVHVAPAPVAWSSR